jgi:hypothetical protein
MPILVLIFFIVIFFALGPFLKLIFLFLISSLKHWVDLKLSFVIFIMRCDPLVNSG